MNSLNHKLLRDLWKMKGQVIAIILVIVSGVGTFVMLRSNMHSLITTKDAFYADYGFADIIASVMRRSLIFTNLYLQGLYRCLTIGHPG